MHKARTRQPDMDRPLEDGTQSFVLWSVWVDDLSAGQLIPAAGSVERVVIALSQLAS